MAAPPAASTSATRGATSGEPSASRISAPSSPRFSFRTVIRLRADAFLRGPDARRALRTVEVCLALEPGGYVASRYDDGAARVELIDHKDWSIRFAEGDDART